MAVARNADGRMEVFARGTDLALIHIWQVGPNTGWANQWMSLGGKLRSVPAVGRNADGRLEVFAAVGDTPAIWSLWHIWQTAPNNNWSTWHSLGGTLTSAPAVSQNEDGRLEVFSRGRDGRLWHIWQTAPNDGWSEWEHLSNLPASLGPAADTDEFPTVGQNADGRLQVFARLNLPVSPGWMTWQSGPLAGWSLSTSLATWAVHGSGAFGRGLIES